MPRNEPSPEAAGDGDTTFHRGIANSVWQSSGHAASNWGAWLTGGRLCGLMPNIMGKNRDFHDCPDFWNRYDEDIALLKKIGANAFRFSLEWSRIQPAPSEVDKSAIERYNQIFDALDAAGIEAHVTLHHFVHPLWFEERGGWEVAENVDYFVEFAELCFREFGSRARLWGTINEPSCTAFCMAICGMHPPGKIASLTGCGRIIQNMLIAHTRVYKAIRALPGGDKVEIGIVHHHLRFEAACKIKWLTPHVRWVANWMTKFWAAPTILKYFETGEFEWNIPFWGRVLHHVDADAPLCLDWWGVNYYTTGILNWFSFPHFTKKDIITDMGYALHPEGMYEWIMEAHKRLGKPIYVTETGCADRKDAFRATCIRSYSKATLAAMAEGADVRGFYYWTLTDNFEWNFGWTACFGLFSYIPDKEDRKLRDGARPLLQLFQELPSKVSAVREWLAERPDIDYSVAANRDDNAAAVPMRREVELQPATAS